MGGGSGDSPCFSGLDGGEGEREMCVIKGGGATFGILGAFFRSEIRLKVGGHPVVVNPTCRNSQKGRSSAHGEPFAPENAQPRPRCRGMLTSSSKSPLGLFVLTACTSTIHAPFLACLCNMLAGSCEHTRGVILCRPEASCGYLEFSYRAVTTEHGRQRVFRRAI